MRMCTQIYHMQKLMTLPKVSKNFVLSSFNCNHGTNLFHKIIFCDYSYILHKVLATTILHKSIVLVVKQGKYFHSTIFLPINIKITFNFSLLIIQQNKTVLNNNKYFLEKKSFSKNLFFQARPRLYICLPLSSSFH